MENKVEKYLDEIVILYFEGYSVDEAIKKIDMSIKNEPFREGPIKITQRYYNTH